MSIYSYRHLYKKLDDIISVIKLNPPYNSLVDLGENLSWSARNDTRRTYDQDKLYQILRNYRTFRDKLERLQRILDNVVKPEGLELIKFTP